MSTIIDGNINDVRMHDILMDIKNTLMQVTNFHLYELQLFLNFSYFYLNASLVLASQKKKKKKRGGTYHSSYQARKASERGYTVSSHDKHFPEHSLKQGFLPIVKLHP